MPEAASPAVDAGSRWESVLESLEADLEPAQDLEQAAAGTWTAPQALGPLPARLAERADRILRAQRQALHALEQAKNDAAKHLAALEAIPSVRSPLQSVYLDVQG